ncbi:MAG: twin-arginine translocase subunit TatC, partial [Methylotenera sp.]
MTPTDNFISHLIELRNRLLRIVMGFAVVFIAFFPFANKIYALLASPLLSKLPAGGQMIATAVTTPFFVPMKVAMMAAFIVSLPHTMYQVWAFVA